MTMSMRLVTTRRRGRESLRMNSAVKSDQDAEPEREDHYLIGDQARRVAVPRQGRFREQEDDQVSKEHDQYSPVEKHGEYVDAAPFDETGRTGTST